MIGRKYRNETTHHLFGAFRFGGTAAPRLILAAKVGQPARTSPGTGSNNQTYRLSDYHGKFVVWNGTTMVAYTQKHYTSGNRQKLQKQWTHKGVVGSRLSLRRREKQGYIDANGENSYMSKMGAAPTAALPRPNGAIGHLYDPRQLADDHHQPAGVIIYDGAIDNRPTDDVRDIAGATITSIWRSGKPWLAARRDRGKRPTAAP